MKKSSLHGWIQLILVGAFIVGSLILSYALRTSYSPPQKSDTADRTIVVKTKTFSPAETAIEFSSTGTVDIPQIINITPQVSGRVIKVSDKLRDGGFVDAGTPLFAIDPVDYELRLEQLKAQVEQAKTALILERAEAKAAIGEYKQLKGQGVTVPDLVARRPQIAQAKANVKSAKAQLAEAELALSRTVFSLPFDGRVISNEIAVGQYLSANQSYGRIYDWSDLEIRTSVNRQQLAWLATAKTPEVSIQIDHDGIAQSLSGRILRMPAVVEENTRFSTVYIGFNGPPPRILPGMFARLSFTGATMQDVTRIPPSALQSDNQIWTVGENSKLTHVSPQIIHRGDGYVLVRGINEPTDVVVSRLSGPTPGMTVTVEKSKDKSAPLQGQSSYGGLPSPEGR
jgi:RND family efflux transporter MFP subunit